MPSLKLHLLGSPRVEIDDVILEIQRRKAKALLFYLAVTGKRHGRDRLAAFFWPESDRQHAHGSLRRHLSELNTCRAGQWLDVDRETIGLHASALRFTNCYVSMVKNNCMLRGRLRAFSGSMLDFILAFCTDVKNPGRSATVVDYGRNRGYLGKYPGCLGVGGATTSL